jgi:hypothetical protein
MSLARLTFEHGRPGGPIRLMAGVHYLKHVFGLSDEAVVKGWVENPYWQYFCGEEYFQHRLSIDPSQMTRFRTRLGPSGCEKLLELTITAGLATRGEAGEFEAGHGRHHGAGEGDRLADRWPVVSPGSSLAGALGEALRHRTATE